MGNITQSRNPSAMTWFTAVATAAIGVVWEYGALWLAEKSARTFPSVSDAIMDRLPRVDFGLWGELLFFALILTFIIPHFRFHWRDTPRVLIALGLFYFVRGWFLYLFPIGPPFDAVDPTERLNIWGFANHAYFPAGHVGVLTTLALHLHERIPRRILWIGCIVFGLGTILSKNHYTMDSVAGMILAYAVFKWTSSRFQKRSEVST